MKHDETIDPVFFLQSVLSQQKLNEHSYTFVSENNFVASQSNHELPPVRDNQNYHNSLGLQFHHKQEKIVRIVKEFFFNRNVHVPSKIWLILTKNTGMTENTNSLNHISLAMKYAFTQPLHHDQDATQGHFWKRVPLVWIQNIPSPWPVTIPRLKCQSALLFSGGRIVGFIPFPNVLVLCEIQQASIRIWT